MKEQYIKQVKKELLIPQKQKKDILRDLEEAFASGLEHGETEQQVLERLGTPKEFAINMEQQLGICRADIQRRNRILFMAAAMAVSVLGFALFAVLWANRIPDYVIGRANAMTSIQIYSKAAINPAIFFLGIGIAAMAALLVQVIQFTRSGKKTGHSRQ